MSSLFVNAKTIMLFISSTPSSIVSNCPTTLSLLLFSDPDLRVAMASNSSKISKCNSSGLFLAASKHSLTFFSDSPTYLLSNSGPLIILIFTQPIREPICLAILVLPHPGGPYKIAPFVCLIFNFLYTFSGIMRVTKILLTNSVNSFSNPPTPTFSKLIEERLNLRVFLSVLIIIISVSSLIKPFVISFLFLSSIVTILTYNRSGAYIAWEVFVFTTVYLNMDVIVFSCDSVTKSNSLVFVLSRMDTKILLAISGLGIIEISIGSFNAVPRYILS
ncbi:hypothetical protein QJ856_gp0489 [Tupanvirus deep ocean]|uniref:Uncharacterized protein n=2 Tax=Tupanvirus TaxID=2094720 RepID=A0AC62A901_9VIRU|nr:hypothetical protein QJ856_gp0489 [Tupanvirus deep ocean]QKU34255.1 hypothetical protein [Tupanvirus deep ocean]